MINRITVLLIFLTWVSTGIYAQEEAIKLSNPSFEDYPRAGRPIRGWMDCGKINFPGETAPDIQPSDDPTNLFFNVTKTAQNGATYLGMVVRDNDSWESLSQRLVIPMESDKCYSFSIYLATSDTYFSISRKTELEVDYVEPALLRIWGGSGYCNKQELLAETVPIAHRDWVRYDFRFEPKQTSTYITLEAFYKTPTLFPYNGNLLVDNCSTLQPFPCKEEAPVIAEKQIPPEVTFTNPSSSVHSTVEREFSVEASVLNINKKKDIVFKFNNDVVRTFSFNAKTKTVSATVLLNEGDNSLSLSAKNKDGSSADNVTLIYEKPVIAATPDPKITKPKSQKEPKLMTELDRTKLKRGQTIRINKLFFKADDATISDNSYMALDEIYDFLAKNNDVVVEIGGHTNDVPEDDYCDQLSTNRAKSVADYLHKKGIPGNRLKYKGYGKRKPVKSNKPAYGRRQNQRVEIKILSLNG